MFKTVTPLLLGLLLVVIPIILFFTGHKATAKNKNDYVKGEILVKFRDGLKPETINDVNDKLGGKVKGIIPGINVYVVNTGNKGIGEAVSAYARDGHVQYVEPNFIAEALVDDPEFSRQWGLKNEGQQTCNTAGNICTTGTRDADIDAPEAWEKTTGSPDVLIAILDSGIDQDHPDLREKITGNADFTTSGTVDDLYGHGTHVAGIAAARTNNSLGVAGVGYDSSLLNVKVLGNDGYGAYSWIASGIYHAVSKNAKIINMSLGSSQRSSTLEEAVNFAWSRGVIIAAAAGNNSNPSRLYPAYYPNCIAVAATDNNDDKASFSSYGSWVDVAAPGENIYSTFPNHPFYLQTKYGRSNNYDFGNGTSMSSPHVAGLAALIMAKNPALSNQEVRSIIEQTADRISGTGSYWVWGRINACNAVGGNCSAEVPVPTATPLPEPTYEPTPTTEPNQCSVCFKGICDGVCHPVKDGALCPDCQ